MLVVFINTCTGLVCFTIILPASLQANQILCPEVTRPRTTLSGQLFLAQVLMFHVIHSPDDMCNKYSLTIIGGPEYHCHELKFRINKTYDNGHLENWANIFKLILVVVHCSCRAVLPIVGRKAFPGRWELGGRRSCSGIVHEGSTTVHHPILSCYCTE